MGVDYRERVSPTRPSPATGRLHDREILRLAVPAFLTLVAEPLFLMADAAVVGHLGTAELAGLGLASVVLTTFVGLCVFLAYGTTASVARLLGAGHHRAALAQGIDGLWLAVGIGVVATVVGISSAEDLLTLFGASAEVTGFGVDYLQVALLGVTPLLLMLATTGVLRGLQDTRTPLYVAIGGNGLNAALNVVLVFGVGAWSGLGIVGSAWGSVVAQVLSAAILCAVVIRAARAAGASLRPDRAGIMAAGRASVPLLVRTLTLRAALVVTAFAVSRGTSGDSATAVATHQLAMTLWTFLAFVLDAIAIAAQALTGRSLGAGEHEETRAITRRMTWWGIWSGVVTGLGLAALSPFVGHLFTSDAAVLDALVPVLLVIALGQPLAGVVFVLDGVLIGAGDGRYLAWAGLLVFVVSAPALVLAALTTGSLAWVWVAFSFVFMTGRGIALLHRARTDRWLVLGAR